MSNELDRADEELAERVDALTDRVPMAKVHLIGRDEVAPSNVMDAEVVVRDTTIFSRSGALNPPYEPGMMCKIHEHSSALRQNVDAYAVNIDGFGHTFEPIIDLEADDAFEKVSDAIYFERLHEAGGDEANAEFPDDDEVVERMDTMRDEMRLEHAKLTALFEFCCADESFITLRTKTRQDKEIMGNGYWEILRNAANQPVQFTYVPGFTVRLMPLDKELTEVEMKVKRSPLTFDTVKSFKRFRKYVQVHEGRKTFFKEFGDPRLMSVKTGMVYEDQKAFDKAEGAETGEGDKTVTPPAATEMLHFAVHSARSPYGVPRWIGSLLAVLGIRQAEEVNYLYFDNKSVPPLAVLVSGGRLTQNSVKKIEDFVENKIKGRKNFHSILIIEAEAANDASLDNASGRMRIEIKPLTDAQQKDGLFLDYDERGMDKIGMSFRLPRLLRGDIRDFNRATAEAALDFTEAQVFSPERGDFDWTINRKLLSELEIRFHNFVSNSPSSRNPIELAEIVVSLVTANVLTPAEAREFVQAVFNKDLKKIEDLWTKIPPELLIAGVLPDDEGGVTGLGDGDGDEIDEEEEEEIPEPVVAADVSTGNLETDGGAKVPAQGKPGKKKPKKKPPAKALVRLPAKLAKERKLRRLAKDLITLRDVLEKEERQIVAADLNRQRQQDSAEVITLSREEFEAFGIIPNNPAEE